MYDEIHLSVNKLRTAQAGTASIPTPAAVADPQPLNLPKPPAFLKPQSMLLSRQSAQPEGIV